MQLQSANINANTVVKPFTFGLRISRKSLQDIYTILQETFSPLPNYSNLDLPTLSKTKNVEKQLADVMKLVANPCAIEKNKFVASRYGAISWDIAFFNCFLTYVNSSGQYIFVEMLDYLCGKYTLSKLYKNLYVHFKVEGDKKKQEEVRRAVSTLLMIPNVCVFDRKGRVYLNTYAVELRVFEEDDSYFCKNFSFFEYIKESNQIDLEQEKVA